MLYFVYLQNTSNNAISIYKQTVHKYNVIHRGTVRDKHEVQIIVHDNKITNVYIINVRISTELYCGGRSLLWIKWLSSTKSRKESSFMVIISYTVSVKTQLVYFCPRASTLYLRDD